MITPAGGILAAIATNGAVTAAGNQGTFRRGAVPPGTAHPLTEVTQIGGPPEYSLDGVTIFEEYVVPVAVVDEQKGPTAPVAPAWAVANTIRDELIGQYVPIDGYRTWRVWEEVGPSELATFADGVSEFRVTIRLRVRVSRV